MRVKANQSTLFKQLKRLPWASRPVTEPATAVTAAVKPAPSRPSPSTPGGIGFPNAEPAIRITRTRTVAGKTSRETAYLTAGQAVPRDLQTWIRRHWHIENRIRHVRDVTFREDLHQARTGTCPAVIATLRNTAIGYHHSTGHTNIARATRLANLSRSHDLITAVTSMYPRTQ